MQAKFSIFSNKMSQFLLVGLLTLSFCLPLHANSDPTPQKSTTVSTQINPEQTTSSSWDLQSCTTYIFGGISLVAGMVYCASPRAHSTWQPSTNYVWGHNLVFTLMMTAYRTLLEANMGSADWSQWQKDATTFGNIVWKTAFFLGINVWQTQVDNRPRVLAADQQWVARQNQLITYIKTSLSMIVYNTRYDKTIINRHAKFNETLAPYVGDSYSSYVAGAGLALTNIAFWFVVPPLWSGRVSTQWANYVRPIDVANSAFSATNSAVGATVVYGFYKFLSDYWSDSVKHTVSGFLPYPSDLEIFRFPDCSSCYAFTNALGKNGSVGYYFWSAREYVRESLPSWPSEGSTTTKEEL